MITETIKKKAMEILSCRIDQLEEKEILDYNAVYFRNVKRGGGAVIISLDGSMLFVDPFFTDYDEHLKKFIAGERSEF